MRVQHTLAYELPIFAGDRIQVEQVILNLVRNAICLVLDIRLPDINGLDLQEPMPRRSPLWVATSSACSATRLAAT